MNKTDSDISVTAALTIQWKNRTRQKDNWSQYAQLPGKRQKDLFKDQFMEIFCNTAVENQLKNPFNINMQLPLAVRTKYIRQNLSLLCKQSGITQVIILGSGYDTLAVRKAKYKVRYVEIDTQHILETKLAAYKAKSIDPNASYIPGDYCQQIIELLKAANVDPTAPSVIIWEGNSFYLTHDQVTHIFAEIAHYFQTVFLILDFVHSDVFTKTATLDAAAGKTAYADMFRYFNQINAPFKTGYNPEELTALVGKFGFVVENTKTAADLAIDYQCDEQPFYTAQDYSLATLRKG
jgi:methyltransferase (TIGR00027 family)